MKDKNGQDIRTGDIVKIKGAYCKDDNGLYYVEHSPGDISWTGREHCLHKIKRNGRINIANYSTAFWPLSAYTSGRKNVMAEDWNRKHATIEIVTEIDTSHIAERFRKEAKHYAKESKDYGYRFGKHSAWAVKYMEISKHYAEVADRISAIAH